MLKIKSVNVYYGDTKVLWNISLNVRKGELLAIVGPNSAGKTTIMRTITGLLTPKKGTIFYEGERIDHLPPYNIVKRGIALVPEGRRLFPKLTVLENLEIGNYLKNVRTFRQDLLKQAFELFPILFERKNQQAKTLSGGESQMLAIARALMSKPKLLLLDEPSLGLAPNLVTSLFQTVKKLNEKEITVIIVEQHISQVLEIANRAYLLENGSIILEDTGSKMLNNEHVKKAYLGL
ncbi:MAG: ABC transporter ATP-binding protein [Candidatus Atribacteria bacterium]